MKRLISILVITAMLLASVMAMIPAFADEIETPKAPTEGTYNVNWKKLVDEKKMKTRYVFDPDKYVYENLYNVDATENSITSTAKDTSKEYHISYYSEDMFKITENTYYEYVFSARNSISNPKGYAGIVFAYGMDNDAYCVEGDMGTQTNKEGAYILWGAFQNNSDEGAKFYLDLYFGRYNKDDGGYCINPKSAAMGVGKQESEANPYITYKIVYDGYKVTFYYVDVNGNFVQMFENLDLELPEGSSVCLGMYNRGGSRYVLIKDASITAKNRESAAILAGASAAKVALAAALDKAYDVILTDYTEDTVATLNTAIIAAETAYTAETEVEEDITKATADVNAAILGLALKKVDFSALEAAYIQLKSAGTSNYNLAEAALLMEAEAAFKNDKIAQSEVDAIVAKINAAMNKQGVIASAEDFAKMDPNGSYMLVADITIDKAYGEFRGCFDGNGHTITLNGAKGVFGTLNNAAIRDFIIEGSIEVSNSVGALATDAKGLVAVANVINRAEVTVNTSNKNVAGFIAQGKGTNLYFQNCVNAADIIGGRTAGFYANTNEGTNNLYFSNCVNIGDISCGEGVSTNPAAGFVARTTDGTTEDIVFENCVELGNIASKYSVGAFFGCGKGNIIMKNCVVGGAAPVEVTAADANSHLRPMGGVIGGANGDADSKDGAFSVVIDGCIFNVNLTVTKNYSTNPMAIVVGGAGKGTVSIKDTSVNGVLDATKASLNAYKLSSTTPTVDNVYINVELKVPAIPDTSKEPISGTGEGETPVYPNKEPADLTPNTNAEDFDGLTVLDARVELAKALKIAAECEIADAKAELAAAKEALKATVAVKDAAAYTEDSYAAYKADIDALIASIDAAADAEALAAINVAEAVAAAETKLVTLEAKAEADAKAEAEAKAKELADAKANALIALSAKRENAGKVFTDASYTEYSAAFDAIKAQIEGAADIAALQAIDVAALKVAAENKLAVNVPAAPEAPDADNKDDDNKNDETDKATEENKDDETEAPKAEGGCGSTPIIIIAIVVVVCGGVALFVMQKKKEN